MKPILAVIGTTGVGKSKLAMQLAQSLGGEIINADSMQVYKGLPIITNKPTKSDVSMVVHHLLDYIDPKNEYSILEFQKDALSVIQDIHSRNKIPILVGGTHYYIQSILWNQQLVATDILATDEDAFKPHESLDASTIKEIEFALNHLDSAHALLQKLDPLMAQKWHAHDIRRIKRSLEIFYSTGVPHSTHLQNQNMKSLRFRTCIFWPFVDLKVLDQRLDERVDDMVNAGLFDEIQEMRNWLENQTLPMDYTRGVLQSIGFKEFHSYFESFKSIDDETIKMKELGLSEMKLHTRQYARKQTHWIKNKLIPLLEKESNSDLCFMALNTVDLNEWDSQIKLPAVSYAQDFLSQLKPLTRELPDIIDKGSQKSMEEQDWRKYTCSYCTDPETGEGKVLNGMHEWEVHLKSRMHRKQTKKLYKDKQTSSSPAYPSSFDSQ